jgi:CRP-like cAMP-binding protein
MNTQLEKQIVPHPFLRSLSPKHVEIMLKNAVDAEFKAGELILQRGEPANRFYLIEIGKVAIEAGKTNQETVQILGAGEVLGWSWLFPPFSWHFSARALTTTKCKVLNGGYLLVTAEENHEFGYDLMRRVAQIVIARLQATREKMIEASASKHADQ